MPRRETSSATGGVSYDSRDGKALVEKIILPAEFETLKVIKGRPGIVPILEWRQDGPHYIIVMEMAEYDASKGIHDPKFDFDIFLLETCKAVSTLHSLNFVHNDLKLENFLKMKDGHWVLTDFGPARKVGEVLDIKFVDPRFKPPWSDREVKVQKEWDMYSLGLMYGTVYLLKVKKISVSIPNVLLGLLKRTPEHLAELKAQYPKEYEKYEQSIQDSDKEKKITRICRAIRKEKSTEYQNDVWENLKRLSLAGDSKAKLFLDMMQDPSKTKVPTIEDIISRGAM